MLACCGLGVLTEGSSAQVRNPLIVQPIVGQRPGSIFGAGAVVFTAPYKSVLQGNRHGKEATISEEASEGSVHEPLPDGAYCFLLRFLSDLQLLISAGRCMRDRHIGRRTHCLGLL